MDERDYCLCLNTVGLSALRCHELVKHFGSAREIFRAPRQSLAETGLLTAKMINRLENFNADDFVRQEHEKAAKNNIRIVAYGDDNYPENLKEIIDAPIILYVKGQLKKAQKMAVAMVGSRRASCYGIMTAERFAMNLSELGLTVVSGLARGIDSAAHRGALKASGSTMAVLGCGLSHVYPPENKNLLSEIVAKGGAVISEFPMEEPPRAYHFPVRNRIISGLALGVIVVEASERSGALITSDCALEQGREVFAVPGKVDSPTSRGVNNLIRQGAKLTASTEDILEELKPRLKDFLTEDKALEKPCPDGGKEKAEVPGLLPREDKLYCFLKNEAMHIDALVQSSGYALAEAQDILLRLELKKLVKQLPGKYFLRLSRGKVN